VNTKLKYWIAAFVLIVWLVLSWFIGSWLNVQGRKPVDTPDCTRVSWANGIAIIIWWFLARDKERGELAPPGAGGDDIDALIREAESRLRSSKIGSQCPNWQLAPLPDPR